MYKKTILFCLCFIVFSCLERSAWAKGDYFITFYGGISSKKSLGETLLGVPLSLEESYLTAIALSKEFYEWNQMISLELEGQVVKHYHKQHNMEYNGVFILRWLLFPWDKYLDTSFAVGEGLSYASRTPEIEAEKHSHATRFLNYLLFELDFAVPEIEDWKLVFRTHHRSGVYGLFKGVHGASNFVCVGGKYQF